MSAVDDWRKEEGRRNRPAQPEEVVIVPLFNIEVCDRVRVQTENSKRRCYNGCFHSSDWKMVWSDWRLLEESMPASRIDFWVDLNKMSSTKSKYRAISPKIEVTKTIKLTKEQIQGVIKTIENPSHMQIQITLMFLRSLLEE